MSSEWNEVWSYLEDRQQYSYYWVGVTLYTTLDTATTRNILTTVFIILNFVIGLVGVYFYKYKNLRHLNTIGGDNISIPINHLIPWMSPKDILKYIWDTRRLPGGRYALVMLLVGMFSVAHQYFVNSFILRVSIRESCAFEHGTVYSPSNTSLGPISALSAADTVRNAQSNAWSNNGAFGIYNKINYTSNIFTPIEDDVIGGWKCTSSRNATINSVEWDNLYSYLAAQKFLFPSASCHFQYLAGDGGGFLAWSADLPNNSTKQWNVRATMLDNFNRTTVPVTDLDCQLNLKAGAIWQPMPSNDTLLEWGPKTYGVLANSGVDSYGFYTELMLNGLTMVAACGNNDQRLLPEGASSSYGCTGQGTVIKVQIWIILAIIFLILVLQLVLICKDLSLRFFIHKGRHAQLAEVAPSGVQDWQLVLLRQSMNDDAIALSEMHNYSYGWSNSQDRFVLGLTSSFEPRVLPNDDEARAGKEVITH